MASLRGHPRFEKLAPAAELADLGRCRPGVAAGVAPRDFGSGEWQWPADQRHEIDPPLRLEAKVEAPAGGKSLRRNDYPICLDSADTPCFIFAPPLLNPAQHDGPEKRRA
jgi:hypothetical protein